MSEPGRVMVCALGWALASSSLAQTAGTPAVAPEEAKAFSSCIGMISGQMRVQRITPERFQIVMQGACADEERALLAASERDFDRMPGGGISYDDKKAITRRSLGRLADNYRQFRLRQVSDYTVWYETNPASKP